MNKYAEYSKQKEEKNKLYRRIHGKVNGCLRKRRFTSEQLAVDFTIANNYQGQRAYFCSHCLHWHLTSK